jgi:hypothetical protein
MDISSAYSAVYLLKYNTISSLAWQIQLFYPINLIIIVCPSIYGF